jgi:hypothetical protein
LRFVNTNDTKLNFQAVHSLNGDKKAFSLLSNNSKGKLCYIVHEDADPFNNNPSDPMTLVSCKPRINGTEFADSSAWYLSVPIFKSDGLYSIEAATKPNSFLRRAFGYLKLS